MPSHQANDDSPEGSALLCAFDAVREDAKSVTSSVGIVILIEGIVPPAAILFLLRKHDLRVMLIINRPVGFWQERDAVHGVVVSVEVKVAGIGKVSRMGTRSFPCNIDPPVSKDQPVQPDLDDLVGRSGVPPHPPGGVACCRAAQRPAWPVDTIAGSIPMPV